MKKKKIVTVGPNFLMFACMGDIAIERETVFYVL